MNAVKICPLLLVAEIPVHLSKCKGTGCAWWDQLAGACCIAATADYIRDVADQLNTLNETKKTPVSAANADEGAVEQNFIETVSTSNITENGGFVK